MMLYDLFISHASEDKEDFVRPLATRLSEAHVEVWYDENSLRLGDSLREAIDQGLARSRFGIVVLSPNFFKKNWAQRELNGLVAREMIGNERVILPIWHGVTKEDVCVYSPPLADVVAVSSERGIDAVVREILRVIRPQGSPLIAARDLLIEYGLRPPVVTDEWWLDVVQATNREAAWGYFPEVEAWGPWTYPLPDDTSTPLARGERLAWTAMQMQWESEASRLKISQMTEPEVVLDFLRSQPGMMEIAAEYPSMTASYAPQLVIDNFGEELEDSFEWLLHRSVEENKHYRETKSRYGSALTVNGLSPACEAYIALRHPTFGDYQPASVAEHYVSGFRGSPTSREYPVFEYLAWFLSDVSTWLPNRVRTFLIEGMRTWPSWVWGRVLEPSERAMGMEEYKKKGALQRCVYEAIRTGEIVLPEAARIDLETRIGIAQRILGLPEKPEMLLERFLAGKFIEGYVETIRGYQRRRRGKPRKKTG